MSGDSDWMPNTLPGAGNGAEEVISGEQVNANEYVIGVEHPVLGHLRETAIPFQLDGAPLTPRASSPEFGGPLRRCCWRRGIRGRRLRR